MLAPHPEGGRGDVSGRGVVALAPKVERLTSVLCLVGLVPL